VTSAETQEYWTGGRPFEFGGVSLIDIDLASAVQGIADAAGSGKSYGLHLCNAFTLTLALRQDDFRDVLAHPNALNLPDGTPVAWFYRLAHRRPARGPVRGPSLMKATLDRTTLRHYLLGGTEDVLADLETVIATRFESAVIAGRHSPPFREPTQEDLDDYVHRIKASGAEVVWVGLGTPRQDRVIAALVGRVDAVLVGVGAAFDFISGHKPEAPALLHRSGMEWAYRLAHEPRRLWRRYLIGNTLFLLHGGRQLFGRPPVLPPSRSTGSVAALPRVAVGAAAVHCVDESTVLDLVVEAAQSHQGRPWLVVTPNIQHVALLEVDERLRAAYDRADLVLADGWPVVRAVRLLGRRRLQRITGADLFPRLCERAARLSLRVGIVGGMDGAAAEAAHRLSERLPGLDVALTIEPAMGFDRSPEEVERIVRQVRDADLDLLFLALGAPKQERFAAEHLDEMGAGVTLCVGAAVDFVAGRQRRAPQVLRRFGMEWAYRAVHEPRRLVPRYARSAPVFLRAVLRSRKRRGS
jgi:N-acetylglucosaminyldiphosphoundecaprenol N-acetyl-beta-D-mannosaminyltransferase